MSRTQATALALVNWRGVFYQRYLLDRHVTALEGANGAGKTTVMIAAYVVLLPDMSRLRFTNLGETGATGGDKGIHGRLGERGRPSYAVLDLVLPDGARLLAGVHLERRSEPTVEPRPFVVRGLAPSVRLQDLLLVQRGESDEVPELSELREAATRLGGQLQTFDSTKDYFAALFDHGVTPLRLSSDEDRNKFNEMLRTSMTGGISRALTSELRGFLLKEDLGLANTLTRMRSNLEACRHTRLEVQEARKLEAEISGIQEVGQTLFQAAWFATRAEAEEAEAGVALVRQAHDSAVATLATREAAAAAAALRRADVDTRRGTVGEARETARQTLDRQVRAHETAARLERIQVRVADQTQAAAAARVVREETEAVLADLRQARERARGTERAAAEGLANVQGGLEELHRRAAEHRRVAAGLERARELLQVPDLGGESAAATARTAQAQLTSVDTERQALARQLADLEVHRREHAEASAAVAALMDEPPKAELHAAARQVLRALDAQMDRVARADTLATPLAEARREAAQQAEVRRRAVALGLGSLDGSAAVAEAALLAQAEHAALETQAAAARQAAGDADQVVAQATAALVDLDARAARWVTVLQKLETLREMGVEVADSAALAGVRAAHLERLTAGRAAVAALGERREVLVHEIRALKQSGGAVPQEVLRLRDELEGELLAARFEEVPAAEAAVLEARLGPLVHAISVVDPAEAALRLAGRARALDTIWLVGGDFSLPEARNLSGDTVVEQGGSTRLTRLPAFPTLGRRARTRRAETLEAERVEVEAQAEGVRADLRALRRVVEAADALLADVATWEAADPQGEIAEVRRRQVDARKASRQLQQQAAEAVAQRKVVGERVRGLRALLSEATLLDRPNREERVVDLAAELEAVQVVRARLAQAAGPRAVVERLLDTLRQAPPDAGAVAEIRSRIHALEAGRDRLTRAIEALVQVASNPEALAWTDAAPALAQTEELTPALRRQHDEASAALVRAEAGVAAAETAREAAMAASVRWQGEREAALADAERVQAELAELAVADASAPALDAARNHQRVLAAELTTLNAEADRLATEVGGLAELRKQAEGALSAHRSQFLAAEGAAGPATLAWETLQESARKSGISPRSVVGLPPAAEALRRLAEQAQVRLTERLQVARDGTDLLGALAEARGPVAAWQAIRDWLQRRVPAQVAEADDPLVALEHLRDHLTRLEGRLGRQETELRGESEDVARGIEVQIRQAWNQVRRLNQHLMGVGFGSIEALQVRIKRVEHMERVLQALREGEAQELLFQGGLPIEEALAEIFRRFGDGRTGGQRLLDYREYMELSVEIRRKGGAAWEVAQPTRLSTGEAIGVGAALMMVVLTEWERDATLIRGRRTGGSLRFLFLDEANRLSHDNLGVLFDLCRTLDLQLLIAAPEVARAEGNTTYRLVRQAGPGGSEEVQVFGRRVEAS